MFVVVDVSIDDMLFKYKIFLFFFGTKIKLNKLQKE